MFSGRNIFLLTIFSSYSLSLCHLFKSLECCQNFHFHDKFDGALEPDYEVFISCNDKDESGLGQRTSMYL